MPGNVKIKSYVFDKTNPTLQSNETILKISFSKGKSVIRDESLRQIKIIYSPAAGPISTCYAASSANDTLWEQSSVDINDIFYMSGDVGIGTSNPVAKLQVSGGDIRLDTARGLVSDIGAQLKTGPLGKTWQAWPADNLSGTAIFQANKFDNTNAFTVQGDGSVGIGTTSPAAPLHIYQATAGAIGPKILLDNPANSTGDAAGILFNNSASAQPYRAALTWAIQAGGSPSLNISSGVSSTYAGLTSRILVSASGEVGLNTTNPLFPLHVVAANNPIIRLDSSNTTNGPRLELNSTGSNGRRWVILSGQAGDTPGAGALDIWDATAGADRLVINTQGNVGIGSSFPSTKLEVAGVARASAFKADQGVPNSADASTNGFSFGGDGDTGLFSPGSGVVNGVTSLYSNNSEVARFTAGNTPSGANVSIYGKTDVVTENNNFGLRVRADTTDNGAILQYTNNAANVQWSRISSTSSQLGFFIASTQIAYINNSGVNSTGFYYSSDKRLKRNISPLNQALDRILKLEGREFIWRDSGRKDIGFIAQEVEKHEPSLVIQNEKGIKSVAYGNITALIIEAIKEIVYDKDQMKKEIEELRKQNEQFQKRLLQLEQKVSK